MLIVCNGNVKSGSTWILQIVNASGLAAPIPPPYRDPTWKNPSIAPGILDAFLKEVDYATETFYCKQHWFGDTRYLELLQDDNIRILNNVRGVRDALVSRYFHERRLGHVRVDTVAGYYFSEGRLEMEIYMAYHLFWLEAAAAGKTLVTRYEHLSRDFDGECMRIFNFLGMPLDRERLAAIKSRTSFLSLKSAGAGQFFRKGVVGDWENHLNRDVVHDLELMADNMGFPRELL